MLPLENLNNYYFQREALSKCAPIAHMMSLEILFKRCFLTHKKKEAYKMLKTLVPTYVDN